MMIVVRHTKQGTKRFKREKLGVSKILEAFGENRETAFVIINGKPATSDKFARSGDKVLVIPAVSGG